MKIAINIIATNKYIEFIPQLIQSIDKYFLVEHEVIINLFTDGELPLIATRLKIFHHKIPAYKFPEATLLRYHIMTSIDYDCDYIFYLDADMKIVDYVGDEILGDLVAVRHPGYFMEKGSGSWETRKESIAYVEPSKRIKYFCGGVQGGYMIKYYAAMLSMKQWIDIDLKAGVMPIFHDESIWNKYLTINDHKELDCSYCIPEAIAKRRYSRIDNIHPLILALEKDFNYFRE